MHPFPLQDLLLILLSNIGMILLDHVLIAMLLDHHILHLAWQDSVRDRYIRCQVNVLLL